MLAKISLISRAWPCLINRSAGGGSSSSFLSSTINNFTSQKQHVLRCLSTNVLMSTDAALATASATVDDDNHSGAEELHVQKEQQQQQRHKRNSRSPVKSRTQILQKGERSYRRYENYAPVLYEWTQKLVTGKLTLDSLMASRQYAEVSKAICDTTRHSDKNILNLLKSLIIMNLDPECRLVQFLENELLFKLEQYDIRLLISAYQLYGQSATISTSSPLRGEIVDALLRNINDRLDSVNASLQDLIQLIKQSRHFTPDILIKIEDQITRFLDSTEDISLDHLCYLLVLLSRYNRRNKPLIRAVVSKLLKFRSEDVYSMPPHLIHMISSLNRLNFPEVNLLEKCSDILMNLNFLEHIQDSPRRDFIVAISQFNFSYPKLIDYYLQKLQEKPNIFKRQDLITLTITLARLNYRSEEIDEIVRNTIIPKCSADPSDYISKQQYFNFVYSLALLRMAPVEYLKVVCSKDFLNGLEHEEMENYLTKMRERNAKEDAKAREVIQELVDEAEEAQESVAEPQVQDIYHVMNLRRKYLTLTGLLINENSGEALKEVFGCEEERKAFEEFVGTLEFEPMRRNKDLQAFKENILKMMDSFAPRGKYMNVNKKLPYGFTVDTELFVNSEGQPQPILNSSESSESSTFERSDLKRVALMCIGFNDTLLDTSSQLIGPKEAELRILRSLGYVVVPVHQNVIPSGTTPLNRVKFLQNLIASHLRESMDDHPA